MSELSVGSLSGLAANSYVIDVASGSQLTQPGMVLQVVRAIDTTDRTTTSATFADTGLSVTVTPTSASSTLFIEWVGRTSTTTSDSAPESEIALQITDSSDTALSGAEDGRSRATDRNGGAKNRQVLSMIGVVSSGSVSAQTFKLRFRRVSGDQAQSLENASNTGQLIVTEIAG